MSTPEWISCAFETVVIRAAALDGYPGGHVAFSERFGARHNEHIVVACSMGGEGYLDEIVKAAEHAGVDRQQDMAFFNVFDLALAPRELRPKPDGPVDLGRKWLEGKVLGGRVMVRGKPPEPHTNRPRRRSHPFGIDLAYRPVGYFWPMTLEDHLLVSVKGTFRRERLKEMLENEGPEAVLNWLAQQSLSEEDREVLGRFSPTLMGGEYLPDLLPMEVEIARITLHSTTGDVYSVRARRRGKRIYYRVVDEYNGEYVAPARRKSSLRPITLGQLEKLIEESEVGLGMVMYNYAVSCDVDGLDSFLQASSQFYPDLARLYLLRVAERLRELGAQRARRG